jgi:neutral ceramidase
MATLRLGVAFGVLTLTLLVFVQLLAALQNGDETPASSFSRSFNQWSNRANAANAANSNLFLVGAGKADVTGYVLQWP